MAMTGVPSIIRMAVAYCAQMNNGSRNHVSPGARIMWTVAIKFKPVRIDENPAMNAAIAAQKTALFE